MFVRCGRREVVGFVRRINREVAGFVNGGLGFVGRDDRSGRSGGHRIRPRWSTVRPQWSTGSPRDRSGGRSIGSVGRSPDSSGVVVRLARDGRLVRPRWSLGSSAGSIDRGRRRSGSPQ